MTWAALLAAALGGGIIASLLDAWFENLRSYETARLLVWSELGTIAAISKVLTQSPNLVPEHLKPSAHYPSEAWHANSARLATRLTRHDSELFNRLSTFYSLLTGFPAGGHPLTPGATETLRFVEDGLDVATLNIIGEAIVYGPRTAIERRRKRQSLPTGAQTGARDG